MKYSIIASLVCIFMLHNNIIYNAQVTSIPMVIRNSENLGVDQTLEKMLTCHTDYGKQYFQQSLHELISDKTELEQRQKYLKQLIERAENTYQLNEHLKACGAHESALKLFGTQNSSISILDEFYFKRNLCKPLNNSAAALNTSFFLHYANLFAPLLEHALMHTGIEALFGSHNHNHHHNHDHHGHGHGCSHHDHPVPSRRIMYYLLQGGHWALHIPGFYEMVTHMQVRSKKIASVQAEIAQLKGYLESVQSLYTELISHHPEFAKDQAPVLARMFAHSNDSISTLVTTILNSSWKSSLQSRLNPGAILSAHAQLEEHAATIHEAAREVGVIDAYVNVAHAMLLQKSRYCFVTFVEDSQPVLKMDGLWHHAISTDSMRCLQVALDEHNRCLLLKGANGTGKSTLLTAVGQALFLAQSWGIAPAQHATITPFKHVYTHSLKRDSIEQGLSHFYYEHGYYENMLTQNDGNTIILLDEPYTCTNSQTGIEYLKTLTNRITQSPGKIALIATHYDI